ncbi:MAG TPA: 2-oxo-4-hydroxy-4-carboxy-5-ureidoimidazoline decarboxylase [Candidatus Limnocylindrales bacterium]|nr:2-oxo-4-hydroxy-4-carboxy-5-ureidoimidazoline decarboxylase [Candidatus Limnocylindrales bacterium]
MRFELLEIFERSPALTGRLGEVTAPDATPEEVTRKAREIISTLSEGDLVATLNAHPRIGADARALSQLSLREQGDGSDPATLAELAQLNGEYERRFGFRFVVFVNGRSKKEIVPVLRERLTRSREAELRAGIEEFLAISLDRMQRAQAAAAAGSGA